MIHPRDHRSVIDTHGRIATHNANVVYGVAKAGGCGLKNLRDGDVCGREFGHHGPCSYVDPAQVADALASKGIAL
jgi:hypothetical protein